MSKRGNQIGDREENGSGDQFLHMASIEVRGVDKAFGPTRVLHDVNLEVADGEFVVLVGPS